MPNRMQSRIRVGHPGASQSKRMVLHAVRTGDEVTVHDIVRHTRISQPTVLKWLTALEKLGLVQRCGHGPSTGGRPPVLYRFNARAGTALGIQVEIPWVRLALLDLNGSILHTHHAAIDTSVDGAQSFQTLLDHAKQFVAKHVSPDGPLVACGLAFSGFVDQEGGVLLSTPRIKDWTDLPLVSRFEQELEVPVSLSHEIDAYTLAEVAKGVAQTRDEFLFLRVGEGLGIRLFRQGDFPRSRYGNAGLIGHTTVDPQGLQCLCGNRGCLEMYVSERALLRRARETGLIDKMPKGVSGGPNTDEEPLVSAVFRAALTDPSVAHLREELTDYLAIAVANAINMFEVGSVIVSGFVTEGREPLRRALTSKTVGRLLPFLAQQTDIAFATVDFDTAGPTGAGLFALQQQQPLDFTLGTVM